MASLEKTESSYLCFDAAQSSSESLYKRFIRIKTEGLLRTQLDGNRLESFFTADLRPAFKVAIGKGAEKKFEDTPQNKEMVDYLEAQIFGILPNYKASVDLDHVKGFTIGGVLRAIFMDKNVARKEIQNAMVGLTPQEVAKQAMKNFGNELGIPTIEVARALNGTLNSGANRQLITNLVKTALEMK